MELLNKMYVRLMLSKFVTSMKSQRGQGLVEYALIIVLIALVCVIALAFLGGRVGNTLNNAGAALTPGQ